VNKKMKKGLTYETCSNCGHKFRHPELWPKTKLTRFVFEGLCITCQNKIPDPNPERTMRCSQ
jgi:DNA-directed RNA polymerase subunit RPC12/RpoP